MVVVPPHIADNVPVSKLSAQTAPINAFSAIWTCESTPPGYLLTPANFKGTYSHNSPFSINNSRIGGLLWRDRWRKNRDLPIFHTNIIFPNIGRSGNHPILNNQIEAHFQKDKSDGDFSGF